MTKRDVLNDNVDLLARAARVIRQQPSFHLSVKPVSGEGGRGIIVSAASKVPSSKASRRITRGDVWANGRPVRSLDAVDGMVPPTQVPIDGGGKTRTAVEAQAWDDARRLVA